MKKSSSFIKRLIAFAVAVTTAVSMLSALAADESTDNKIIFDKAGVISEETGKFIEDNLNKFSEAFGEKSAFLTVDDISKESEKMTFIKASNGVDEDVQNLFVWSQNTGTMHMYSKQFPNLVAIYGKDISGMASDFVKGMTDSEEMMTESFKIYSSAMYYYNDKTEYIPSDITINGENAEQFIVSKIEEDKLQKYIIGFVVFIGIIALWVIFLSRRKVPEGTVPGDGSHLKKGYASGVFGVYMQNKQNLGGKLFPWT